MIENITYYAIFPNAESTSEKIWEKLYKDKGVLFYVKSECRVSYSYGSHYNYEILDENGNTAIFHSGNFDVLKFYNAGMQSDFQLIVELKDRRNHHLYHHVFHGNEWSWSNRFHSILLLLNEINAADSYNTFILQKENAALKVKIKELQETCNIQKMQLQDALK